MKAILIDPVAREVKGIEIDPTKLNAAFGGKKTLLLTEMIGQSLVLYHNGIVYAVGGQKSFWFEGVKQSILGKGLLVGREKGKWPAPITLNARDVECLVRFSSDK